MNGAHEVDVRFCGCVDACDPYLQLLRIGWYPATILRPRTAFTFNLLSTIHELTLQSKINLYDVYHTILRVTSNTGLVVSVVSQFLMLHSTYDAIPYPASLSRAVPCCKRVEKPDDAQTRGTRS